MEISHISWDQAVEASWRVERAETRNHILLLILKGQVNYRFGDTSIDIRKGEGLFIRQGVVREALAVPGHPHFMLAVHFRTATGDERHSLPLEPFRHFRPDSFDYMKQRFAMMYEGWIGQMPFYDMICRGILLELLGVMQRELAGNRLPANKRNLAMRMQEHIVHHYRKPLRLSELAVITERTPNYISSVFKEVTGRTPIAYLHEVRIAAARELLMTTNMTIGQIADFLGYCDQTYFNQMYKKIVGHPPSHTLKKPEHS